MLPDGHQVSQHLAGVAEVGQAVDDGDGGVFGQRLHFFLGEGADHNAVAEAGENAGGVLHRLVAADLTVLVRQIDALAAQLVDARLEGDAGAGGAFLKDHGQGLPGQEGVLDPGLFHGFELVGGVQNFQNVLAGQVQQLQQVFFHGGLFPFSTVFRGA